MAIFGNFVNRAMVLTHKYFGGKVPACGSLEDIDKEALAQIPALKASMEKNIEEFKFREALKDAMGIARVGNKYISDSEPWKVAKTDLDRTATILNISLQICADLAIAFEPFTPFAAKRLREMLGSQLDWEVFGRPQILPAGHQLGAAELLFAKIEDDAIDAQLARLDRIRAEREAAAKAEAATSLAICAAMLPNRLMLVSV